jgi:hypothetical protein
VRLLPVTAIVFALAQPLGAQSAPDRAARSVTEATVRRHIETIAHDSMLGRATPSRGLDLTAAYMAAEFRRYGLLPGGDSGTYVQRYPLSSSKAPLPPGSPPPRYAPNAVGILPGTDPLLRNEYVVFSAHIDHVGFSTGQSGDSIFNGADDDASGTAAVIELARAFSLPGARPRRSLIFVGVSGEERGLLGSEYFTTNPPVPLKQMVANINLDMIGRNWRDTIAVIGREHSDLGETVLRVALAHPELKMMPVADRWPEENFFFRSDHFNFARRGVPAIFFFNGTHADYHRPGDSPEKIDAEKEARIVRLVFFVGREIGDAPRRPAWKPASFEKIVQQPDR